MQEFKVAYQQEQLEKLIFDYTAIIVGSWKSRFKTLNLNFSGTIRDVAPKQKQKPHPCQSYFEHA